MHCDYSSFIIIIIDIFTIRNWNRKTSFIVRVEKISLTLGGEYTSIVLSKFGIWPGVIQSLLWPLHNTLLVTWIMVIFVSTLFGSIYLIILAIVFPGTEFSLEDIFTQEIIPCRRAIRNLCGVHHVVSVRILGLLLYPLGWLCAIAQNTKEYISFGKYMNLRNDMIASVTAGVLYVVISMMTWWYWLYVLPLVAVTARDSLKGN